MRKHMTITVAMMTLGLLVTGCSAPASEAAKEEVKTESVQEEAVQEPEFETVVETETVEGADILGLLSQTIDKAVEYRVDPITGEKEIVSEICKGWKVNHKKLGGTAWKASTSEGDTYIRLRDTIEFFKTTINPEDKSVLHVNFATTILGAVYTEKDGEPLIERIHIMSGTVTADGKMTVRGVKVADNTEIEYVLDEFERIDKADLPFSEEEFRAVSDQLG